jgi:hypothetical protein
VLSCRELVDITTVVYNATAPLAIGSHWNCSDGRRWCRVPWRSELAGARFPESLNERRHRVSRPRGQSPHHHRYAAHRCRLAGAALQPGKCHLMTHETQRIRFSDFVEHLQYFFTQARDQRQAILIERDGETYRLEREAPANVWQGYDPEKVQRAFAEGRGMFAGTDRERFLREVDEERGQGPNRPD